MAAPNTSLAQSYAHWRATTLGQLTEKLETRLIFAMAGPLEGKRLLDIGTGDGTYALEAAARGALVTGLDSNPEILDAAIHRSEGTHPRMDFRQGRVEALPFGEASFDMILAVTVLCFVSDTGTAIREMARVLVPGGRVILGELGRFNVWAAERRIRGWFGSKTWQQVRFRSRRELGHLAGDGGFRNIRVESCIYFPPSEMAARILAPVDALLSRMHAPGAAFIAVSADKPLEQA